MQDLKGKVVFVSGASTGIGAAAAVAFGKHGSKIVVHYNASRGKAEAVAQAIRDGGAEAMTVAADVRDSAAIDAAVGAALERFGRIDVLVNNAGSLIKRALLDAIDDALFDEVVQVNARSVVAFSRAVLPGMKAQGGGNIINVTSVAARHGGGPGSSIYAASKAFVSTFTRATAKELTAFNIRVNAVSPGVIVTPFHDRFSSPEQMAMFAKAVPMGRLGNTDECNGAFLYLASEDMSAYVTGQMIEVNGGMYMP